MSSITSQSSTQAVDFVLGAPMNAKQLQELPEYKVLTSNEDATAIIHDAVTTQTLLRSSGDAVKDFPGYDALRFIATQEGGKTKRGFETATNQAVVRAACMYLYKHSKPERVAHDGTRETTVNTKTPKIGDSVIVKWRGTVDSTLEYAYFDCIAYSRDLAAEQARTKAKMAADIVAKLTPEQIALLREMLAVTEAPAA